MNDQTTPNAALMERSSTMVALDNLIRRQLRVSDPRDHVAIAKALRERYADEREALEQEAAGLPFFKVTAIAPRGPAETATRVELQQGVGDVEQDLTALSTNALLKDIQPELRGWGYAIRQVVSDGTNAARFALDPWQRDRAMAARRQLGDYARVARFVGALTPTLSLPYRKLAQSLDEVASVILVLMGDALANIGFGSGRFLLQAPASELQARRDAVIYALRNLIGTTEGSYGPNEWPYGPVAYRQVSKYLEDSGLTDLRTLFQENYVARAMDELIHWATGGTAEDLRALGATAQPALARFRRLVLVAKHVPNPESPPFAAYLNAIQLFVEAFANAAAGYRLLYVARPPVAFYGLYGVGGPDKATQRLLQLTSLRGQLATRLDCYLGCDCDSDDVRCQVMLDKVLYDLDRAIDLYVMGTDPEGQGQAEQRAAAYAIVILLLTGSFIGLREKLDPHCDPDEPTDSPNCGFTLCVEEDPTLSGLLSSLVGQLWWLELPPNSNIKSVREALEIMHQELCVQRDAEAQWENLLHTMAPSCFSWNSKLDSSSCTVDPPTGAKPTVGAIDGVLVPTQDLVETAICVINLMLSDNEGQPICPDFEVGIPADAHTSQSGGVYGRSATGVQRNTKSITDMALCAFNEVLSKGERNPEEIWKRCGPTDFTEAPQNTGSETRSRTAARGEEGAADFAPRASGTSPSNETARTTAEGTSTTEPPKPQTGRRKPPTDDSEGKK